MYQHNKKKKNIRNDRSAIRGHFLIKVECYKNRAKCSKYNVVVKEYINGLALKPTIQVDLPSEIDKSQLDYWTPTLTQTVILEPSVYQFRSISLVNKAPFD